MSGMEQYYTVGRSLRVQVAQNQSCLYMAGVENHEESDCCLPFPYVLNRKCGHARTIDPSSMPQKLCTDSACLRKVRHNMRCVMLVVQLRIFECPAAAMAAAQARAGSYITAPVGDSVGVWKRQHVPFKVMLCEQQ